jgi:hypothetical protein
MKYFFSTVVFAAATSTRTANGFLVQPTAKAGLTAMVDAQPTQKVAINLDIGHEGDDSRLAITGMTVDLYHDHADYEHVAMPGENGPHPKLSSGSRKLDLVKQGEFVSLTGSKLVQAIKGCWELVWKKDSPAGALLCGFEIPEEYKRNGAALAAGRVYLSFPVWTKETLVYAREQKKTVLQKAADALKEKDEHMEKYQAHPNPLMKALHYRNAYAAAEKYWLQPVKLMQQVPEENEVFELQKDLFCTTKGLVWSKSLPRGQQVLLGTANLAAITTP